MKKHISKFLITLGLLLFITLFLPELNPAGISIAQATSIEKGKNEDYRLNVKNKPIVKGKTFTLRVYNTGENSKISFKSADSEIASVSDDGIITANKVGTTTITATIKDGSNSTNLTCDVTVGPPAFSVKMTKSRMILGLDKSDSVNVIMKPSNTAEDARFSSYDSSIASISTGGRVTAKQTGLTYIFAVIDASNNDGTLKFDTCIVIVTAPEDVQPLETYFSEHPELNTIPEADLLKALETFFNRKLDDTSKSSGKLTEELNDYLDSKFDLSDLRKKMEEAASTNTK